MEAAVVAVPAAAVTEVTETAVASVGIEASRTARTSATGVEPVDWKHTGKVRPVLRLKPSGTGGFLLDRFGGVNMVDVVSALELSGYGLGALGAALVFFEFFQLPSYVEYSEEYNDYSMDISPAEVTEHTWIGRVGAFLIAVAFALEFLAVLLS